MENPNGSLGGCKACWAGREIMTTDTTLPIEESSENRRGRTGAAVTEQGRGTIMSAATRAKLSPFGG
jgi:hypothetical protein